MNKIKLEFPSQDRIKKHSQSALLLLSKINLLLMLWWLFLVTAAKVLIMAWHKNCKENGTFTPTNFLIDVIQNQSSLPCCENKRVSIIVFTRQRRMKESSIFCFLTWWHELF